MGRLRTDAVEVACPEAPVENPNDETTSDRSNGKRTVMCSSFGCRTLKYAAAPTEMGLATLDMLAVCKQEVSGAFSIIVNCPTILAESATGAEENLLGGKS